MKKHIDFNYHYVFTRSPLVSIFVTKSKKNLIYEAHNAYYTKQKFLDKYYRFKFKKIIKKDSFQLFISISENLKQYWLEISSHQEKHTLELFREKGLQGMHEYWDHIRIEENCDLDLKLEDDKLTQLGLRSSSDRSRYKQASIDIIVLENSPSSIIK